MRLLFPFLALPRRAPPTPRPAVWLRVVGPRGDESRPIAGLVDTGAFSTILPADLAVAVGVSPRPGSSCQVLIGGGTVRAWEAGEVVLRVQGPERDSKGRGRTLDVPSRALVVWSPSFLDLALLGLGGFLDGVDELCVRAREQVFEIARG